MRTTRAIPLFLFFFLLFPDFNHAAMVTLKTADGKEVRSANQVLVRYKNWRPRSTANRLEKIGVQTLQVPASETLESFLKKLAADPNVEFAEPNVVVQAMFTPSDGDFGSQYALASDRVNMPAAWDITQGSATVVVAVIDTGVTLAHPDLAAKLWSDGNGFHGATMNVDWNGDGDCVDTDPESGPEMCLDNTPDDDNSTDAVYHGTHVSGIIAATTNNALNMAGICPNCRIMAVKVLNRDGAGTSESVANGIIFAVDSGASVINMSLGSSASSPTEEAAVAYAIGHNVVVVAASGNARRGTTAPCSITFPAAINSVISVGAVDRNDAIAYFSCGSNAALDLVAPGVDILSTTNPNGTDSVGNNGTSYAAPMVAGVAGLIRSLNPNLTPAEVNRYINFNTDDIGVGGYDGTFGFGRLNALKVLQAVQAGTLYASNPGFPDKTFPEPNPFHPLSGVAVKIRVPASMAAATDKKITFFNISGEEIKTLQCDAECSWDGKNSNGGYVASGLYHYRVESSRGNIKGKITVIK